MTIRMTSTRSVPYSFPLCLGKPYHEQHDKEGMERMQNDAGQVMAERIESPDSVVESMRNPGNRVPVTFIRMEKAPREKSILKKRMALFAITWSLSSHAPMNPFQRAGRYTINVMTATRPATLKKWCHRNALHPFSYPRSHDVRKSAVARSLLPIFRWRFPRSK
jgi:hypothetical protein